MEQLIIYQSESHTFVLHPNDEAEFVARFFGEEEIDWEEWQRIEVDGPVEVSQPATLQVDGVYETYEI